MHAFIDRTNGYGFHHHIGITTLGGSVRILVPLTTANSTILQVSNFGVLTDLCCYYFVVRKIITMLTSLSPTSLKEYRNAIVFCILENLCDFQLIFISIYQ